jgi:hypothetical protein
MMAALAAGVQDVIFSCNTRSLQGNRLLRRFTFKAGRFVEKSRNIAPSFLSQRLVYDYVVLNCWCSKFVLAMRIFAMRLADRTT